MEQIEISADKFKINRDLVFSFISRSYWGKNRSREIMDKAIENSLCFGAYINGDQIGFARIVTDYATFAYLADVFILEEYRGMGYSKELMKYIMEYEPLKDVAGWRLATTDAHGLYEKFGFHRIKEPEKFMELKRN